MIIDRNKAIKKWTVITDSLGLPRSSFSDEVCVC
jgi:hypothetical protein